jgi:hypothetical protein
MSPLKKSYTPIEGKKYISAIRKTKKCRFLKHPCRGFGILMFVNGKLTRNRSDIYQFIVSYYHHLITTPNMLPTSP